MVGIRTMLLVFVILAVCGAAKLDRSYLPPLNAKAAGGTFQDLLAPIETKKTPTGSYVNEEQGVVVDAVSPGTRASGVVPTGLGASRNSYGSINSKVGDAAFTPPLGSNVVTRIAPGFNSNLKVKENNGEYNLRILPISDPTLENTGSNNEKTHGNTLKFNSEISKEQYSYGYETDNGILVGENGVSRDGIEANGGYSYKGDDGKVYSVRYTADKEGYRPNGIHLPTPPPIPVEIVKSLEDNARDEAKGIVDDGSYDARKYNIESDNSNNNDDSKKNLSINKDATNSFSHGKYTSHTNTDIPVVNSQSTEFLSTQNFYKYSSPAFNGHEFENKHSDFGIKQNVEQNNFGLNSQYGYHNTGFPSVNNGVSLPHAGDSFASAIASTGNNVDNDKLLKSKGSLNRTPISPVGNSAYSSAVAIGSRSASASAFTAPNHATFENKYYPLHIKTFEQFEQDSIFGKNPSTIEATPSLPIFTSASPTVSGNQDRIVQVDNQSENSKEKSTNVYKQYYNLGVPLADSTFGLPPITGYKPVIIQNPTTASVDQADGSQLKQGTLYEYNKPTTTHQNIAYTSNTKTVSLTSQQSPQQQQSQKTLSQTHGSQLQQGTLYEYNKPTTYQNTAHTSNIKSNSLSLQQIPQQSQSTVLSREVINNFDRKPEKPNSSSFTLTQKTESEVGEKTESTNSKLESNNNSQKLSSQASHERNQGTIYHYNKPSETILSNKETSNSMQISGADLGIITQNKTQSRDEKDRNIIQDGASSLSQLGKTTAINGKSTQKVTNSDQKPFVLSRLSGAAFSQNTFGSASGSQFGQNLQATGIKGQSMQLATNSGQKPFGPSQITSSALSQNTFGSTSGSQFGQKPQLVVGTKSEGKSDSQNPSDTQFVTESSQLSQKGSSSLSQFGQTTPVKDQSTPQITNSGQKPFGSFQSTGPAFSQNTFGSTFGSQFEQNLQPNGIKGQSTQPTSSSGQKPFSSTKPTDSTFSQNTFGSASASQFGQNLQATGIKGQSMQSATDSGQKPFGVSQTTSSALSQNTFGSTPGFQFGQKPQLVVGTKGKSDSQNPSDTHFVTESSQLSQQGSSSLSQFGQTTAVKGQSTPQVTNSGQKPFGSFQSTGPAFSQNTFGSTFGSQFGQNLQPKGIKGQSTQLTSSSGQKPFSSTKSTGSTFSQNTFGSASGSQFGQNLQATGIKGQSMQLATNSGQKPFGSSQTTSSALSQNTFASTSGSQFGQKPQLVVGTKGKSDSQNPSDTQFVTRSSQLSQKGSTSLSQFGQTTAVKGQSTPQITNSGQKPFGSFQSTGSSFSQNTFGSTFGSQFGQNLQPNGIKGQSTQLTSSSGQKPFSSTKSTGSTFSQNTFGSASGSQFGQNLQATGIKGQSMQLATNSGQKPFGSSQTTSSALSQNTFGSTSGSQFGQKPQLVVGTKGKSDSQNPSDTQFVTRSSQLSQKGSTSLSQFGQTTAVKGQSTPQITNSGQKPFGSFQSTGSSFSQNTFGSTFGSQFGQNLQPNGIKGQSTQLTSSSGQKPFSSTKSTGSTFSQNTFGSASGSQFGQNLQATGIKGQSMQLATNSGQKPFGSSQTTSSALSQNTFASTSGSQFGQKPQLVVGTKGKSDSQNPSDTQFVTRSSQLSQKGSTSLSQFGQTTAVKGQSTPQITNSGQKPFGSFQSTGSSFSQNTFGSTSGSQFGQNLQPNGIKGQSTQLTSSSGQKPFSSTKPPGSTFSQNTFGSASGSQFGQNLQATGIKGQSMQLATNSGQKPFGSSQTTSSTLSQNTFGSTSGSQFGQKPQLVVGTKGKSDSQNLSDTQFVTRSSQLSQKGSTSLSQFGQTTAVKGQSTPQITNSGQKPFGSFQSTGSSFSQNTFGSTFGSQFGQNLQPNGIKGQSTQLTSSSGQKPFSSTKSTGSTFSQNTFGSASGSQFGQNLQATGIKGQSMQLATNTGQKPFGSFQTTSSSLSQNTFGSTSGSQFGQKPQLVVGTKGKSDSQNPSYTQFVTRSSQLSQKGSSSLSQFGQTTAVTGQSTPQITNSGQKPFGSFQSTGSSFSQNTFGSTFGSQFGQNLQPNGIKGQSTQLTSSSGQKPFSSTKSTGSTFSQNTFESASGSQFGQNLQATGIKGQSMHLATNSSQKPFGSSQTTSSALSQNIFGSTPGSQFGQKPQLVVGTKGKSDSQNPSDTQYVTGSLQLAQKGSPSLSQFGQTTAVKGQSTHQISNSGQKPFGSFQSTGSSFSQNTFGSTFGSQFGQNLQPTGIQGQTNQLTSSSGQKPFCSSKTTDSAFSQNTFRSVTGSQFGQNLQDTGKKGQITQQTSIFGQKPYELSQTTVTAFSQNNFGSTSGPQFGNTQAPVSYQFKYKSEQGPQSTASAFATSNSGSRIEIIPDPVYQFTQFGKVESEVSKPFISKDSSFKFVDINPSLNLGSFGYRPASSQAFASSRPTVNFNTKTKIIPATQISIDQLRSAAGNAKSAFNEKSSQSTSTHINLPLNFKVIPSPDLSLRSQDSSSFTSAVSAAQTLTSNENYENQPDKIFVGQKEVFVEQRAPPTFDIKTGYHY